MYDKQKILEIIKGERSKGTMGEDIVTILNNKGFTLKNGDAIKLKNYYGWVTKNLSEADKIYGKPKQSMTSAGIVVKKERQPKMIELPLIQGPKGRCAVVFTDIAGVADVVGALWK